MKLKNRIAKLEAIHNASREPDESTLFWWGWHRQEHPEEPERPPDDWIAYFNGMTHDKLMEIIKNGVTS